MILLLLIFVALLAGTVLFRATEATESASFRGEEVRMERDAWLLDALHAKLEREIAELNSYDAKPIDVELVGFCSPPAVLVVEKDILERASKAAALRRRDRGI
jgi:hypothetical protein